MTHFLATSDGFFSYHDVRVKAAFGKGGFLAENEKKEGDGATPFGTYRLRRILYRPDRLKRPETQLCVRPISADDGWCDDPADAAYNRPVRLPYPASHEVMMREDELYDIVVVLSHNDDPPVPGLGSAIFLHCAKPGYPPTQGCVAIDRDDLIAALKLAGPESTLEIKQA